MNNPELTINSRFGMILIFLFLLVQGKVLQSHTLRYVIDKDMAR